MRVFTVSIQFPYGDPERVERNRIIQGLEDIGVDLKHIKPGFSDYTQDFMLTETQLVDITIWGNVKFEIKMFCEVGTGNAALVQRISAITARLDQISSHAAYGDENNFNQKCNQHQPGNMLSHYNETMLLEDCCTDYLQGALNQGWRIIVACPQPDARRADYVLGRFTNAVNISNQALREYRQN